MTKIVPIDELERRLPEHGRIRIGEKGGKGQPQKIDVFRFTSDDRDAIDQIADLYGGEVKAWEGKWEVKTQAKAIPVVLPPDPLGGTPIYELWAGGGVLRRCDGETCLIPRMTQAGAEMQEAPCICVEHEKLECKPKTRLVVILPEIRFGGGWRLESGGWNTAHEMPGMVDMIQMLQAKGLSRAELALEERVSKFAGKTRRFVVPVLRPAVSMDLMLEGQGAVLALGKAASEPEPAPSTPQTITSQDENVHVPVTPQDDWDIVDAEIVEAPPTDTAQAATVTAPPSEDVPEAVERKRKKMHALLREIGMGNTERHALVLRITGGRHSSSNDLDEGGLDMLIAALDAMKKAEAFFEGVDENGWAVVSRA